MAVSAEIYGTFFENLKKGELGNLEVDDIQCALLDSGYTFSHDHDNFTDDVSANEIDDADYSQQTLSNVSVTRTDRETVVDADDVNFGDEVNISASYAVLFDETSDKLIFFVDFDGEEESVDGKFEIQWHEDGIFSTEAPA